MERYKGTFYLVRHGTSVANERRIYSSIIEQDMGLSELGKKQVLGVAEFLADKKIRGIYSSPFKRAIQTSEAISKKSGCEIETIEALREMNCGKWEGYTEMQIQEKFRNAWKGWHYDPQNNPIPGGESLMEVQVRALPVFNSIVKKSKGKNAVIVTHYCVFNVLLCSLVSSLANFRCFDTAPATIAEIRMENIPRLRIYSHPFAKV